MRSLYICIPTVPYIFSKLKEIIERGEDLPTLPSIVLQLHQVLDDDRAGANAVASVIGQDPALTARLLRAANSAAFSRGTERLGSVSAAVSRMGLNQVRSVCIVLAVVRAFGNSRGLLNHHEFWTHSATVATIASDLWRRYGDNPEIKPEDAYVAGLLHDVGLLVLEQYFPSDFEAVLRRQEESSGPLWSMEEEELGLDHGAVAGLLVGRWALPPFIGEAVANHHHPEHSPDQFIQLARVLEAAEAITWEAGAALPQEGAPMEAAIEVLKVVGADQAEADEILLDVPAIAERARRFLA